MRLRSLPCRGLACALAVLLALPAGALPTLAQQLRERVTTMPRQSTSLEELLDQGLSTEIEGVPQEGPIDPERYRLIPGDVLHLGLWGEMAIGYPLTVGPEGDLIVPNVGPVPVAGETIRAAEEEIAARLKRMYPQAVVSLRLIQPGRFLVSVTGMVRAPGIYESTRLLRLTSVLASAGGIRAGGSLRRITIRNGSTSTREIDLLPWVLGGDLEANPMLDPGEMVEVPERGSVLRVRGPVNGRGGIGDVGAASGNVRPDDAPNWTLEWKDGDTVGSVLALVGGLSDLADGSGTLIRNAEAPQDLNLRNEADLALEMLPGDELEVRFAPRWVFVIGSVRSPGRYPYLPGLDVRDYVYMAGGPTELGRHSGWKMSSEDGEFLLADPEMQVEPGTTIRVPERRSYSITNILAPVTSATALIISVVALVRQNR
jgi:protein involved in polysaccharide export with SLBB domain